MCRKGNVGRYGSDGDALIKLMIIVVKSLERTGLKRNAATSFVRKALVKFFSRNFKHFDKTTGGNCKCSAILTGCRPSKFSLHIIVDDYAGPCLP
jgi:hypothetical protein